MTNSFITEGMLNEIIDDGLIIDNDFMDKDVSELIKDDFYIFHATQEKMYFYYKGFICIGDIVELPNQSVVKIEYTLGTLQEFVDGLDGCKE